MHPLVTFFSFLTKKKEKKEEREKKKREKRKRGKLLGKQVRVLNTIFFFSFFIVSHTLSFSHQNTSFSPNKHEE